MTPKLSVASQASVTLSLFASEVTDRITGLSWSCTATSSRPEVGESVLWPFSPFAVTKFCTVLAKVNSCPTTSAPRVISSIGVVAVALS